MKLYAPAYYKDFKCIADKCTHSCCVGWEISVDEQTEVRYNCLSVSEREEILSHIEDGVIRLCPDGKCPFLDGQGLCRIISGHGEGYVSEICREHPRFYNFCGDRAEVGLGLSCEEAARIALSSDDYDKLVLIGEKEGESESDFNSLDDRDYIFSVLKKSGLSYHEKIDLIKRKYYLPRELFSRESALSRLSELEYLRDEDKEILCRDVAFGAEEDLPYCERFFAYLVYRHVSCAASFDNMRARLCFCILLSMIFESLLTIKLDKTVAARLISEEIEYSEENIDSLIFDFECEL